jgi:hypothetical protein
LIEVVVVPKPGVVVVVVVLVDVEPLDVGVAGTTVVPGAEVTVVVVRRGAVVVVLGTVVVVVGATTTMAGAFTGLGLTYTYNTATATKATHKTTVERRILSPSMSRLRLVDEHLGRRREARFLERDGDPQPELPADVELLAR